MNQYVVGVLKAEVGSDTYTPSWHLEALKAMAVAIRSFTWTHGTVQTDGTLEMGSTPSSQTFFPEKPTNNNYPNAATYTSGQFLSHPEGEGLAEVITGNYSSQHGPNAGTFYTRDGGKSYLKSVYDPILDDIPGPKGHGWGLAQLGAYAWAIGRDYDGNAYPSLNYRQILAHYYTGVHIKNANNNNVRLTPDYRWVPLTVDWGSGSVTPPSMIDSSPHFVEIEIQNAGAAIWLFGTTLSYHWKNSGGQRIEGSYTVSLPATVEGGTLFSPVLLAVTPPGNPGVYTLHIDLIHPNDYNYPNSTFFHEREAGRPWYTLKYEDVCVGPQCAQHIFLPVVFKNSGTQPPDNCDWVDLLEVPEFSYPHFNTPWKQRNMFDPDPTPGEEKHLLHISEPYSLRVYPPAGSPPGYIPYSVALGGRNDPDGYILYEHAFYQWIPSLPSGIDKVAIEYDYYLTTEETTINFEYDKFFVDLQADGFSLDGSILPTGKLKYTNLHPLKNQWRTRGCPVGESGCDGLLIATNMSQYAGKPIYLVFYSEFDFSLRSTFYIDNIRLKGCTTN